MSLTNVIKRELNAQRRANGLPALGSARPVIASRYGDKRDVKSAQGERNERRKAKFYARWCGEEAPLLTIHQC